MSFRPALVETNPNDAVGGGGCLCNPIRNDDVKGPFFIFTPTETESNLSPHAVLCAGCVGQCVSLLAEGDVLAGGEVDTSRPEPATVDGTAEDDEEVIDI